MAGKANLAPAGGRGDLRGRPSRRPMSNAATWAAAGLITPAVAGAALAAATLPGDRGYVTAILVVAGAYFLYWLSAGADLLWEWHSGALPAARPCVRCGHTAAAHRDRASCAVRAGSLDVWARCPCAGYVPPGRSPGQVSQGRPAPAGRSGAHDEPLAPHTEGEQGARDPDQRPE